MKSDDNGSVSFSDGSHPPVAVTITNGVLAATTANLTGLTDGTITATLHLNNDAAGNSFTNVTTAATLDRDTGEQAALKLTVNNGQPIGAATASAVPFTVAGLETDDSGSVSFSDGSHAPVPVAIANGAPAATTANLAELNDGTITATLHLNNDAAGNFPGGSFQPAPSLLTGSSPIAITAADANGDGKVDLFVTNANSSTVSVLLGNGDGSFQAPQTYATGPGPVGIATADVNGDGKADLLVTNNSSNTVSVLLGNGDGTFQAQQTYATGISPQGITTADVNGDGKVDLLVANAFDNTVGVLLGNGDGTFQVQQAYRTGGTSPGTARITTADVNRDGKVDILVTEVNTNIVSVLLGNGDGTFQAPQTYATGPGPQGVTTADVNGDGNVDLMVANWRSNNVSVLLGNGDGTFQAQQTYATGNNPFGITTADVNGDGKTDLVVTNQGSDTVSVLLGNGDGTFQAQQTYAAGSSPFGITTADVNGDGRPDIAVADTSGNTVTVLLNQASTTTGASFTIDQDSGEQVALSLAVNGGHPIGAATAGAVPFTVGGLESDDNGSVSFSDGSHPPVAVTITNGVIAATTANLTGLTDGTITATLHLNNDAAGNSFTNVITTATLDRDTGEQVALSLAVNGGHPIGAATAGAVPFTVGGLESDDNGSVSFSDGSHPPVAVTITNGVLAATTANLTGLTDGTITATLHLNNDAAGNSFTNVTTTATLDRDTGEQVALSLAVNGGHPIGAATAGAVPFTVGGLESDDNGSVSFSDGSHPPVAVTITNGVLAATTANLTGLTDGTITATLHLNNDAAGNSFTNVTTTATLDRDTGEQAALKLTVNNGQPIGAATASAVPFTVAGLETDDSGSVSFSDGSHAPVPVAITNGVLAATTVNLAGLNDGPITATLHLNNDAAGNSFTNVITAATLDTDRLAETPTLTAPSSLTVAAGKSAPLGIILKAVDSDDTLSVSISGLPSFELVTAAGCHHRSDSHQTRENRYLYRYHRRTPFRRLEQRADAEFNLQRLGSTEEPAHGDGHKYGNCDFLVEDHHGDGSAGNNNP